MKTCSSLGLAASVVMALAATASAQPHSKYQIQQLEETAAKFVAEPGRDKAPTQPPPWCGEVKPESGYDLSGIRSQLETIKSTWTAVFKAAQRTCLYPNEPVVAKAVAAIHQYWINVTGLPAKEALESFTARLADARFVAAKAQLCGALKVSAEVEGEDRAFMAARQLLFGCFGTGAGFHALWLESGRHVDSKLLTYLDLSSGEPDEIVRLAKVVDHARGLTVEDKISDLTVLAYVIDQHDYKALSAPKLMQQLETAPYKGNVYARTVVLESLGRARMELAVIEAEITRRSADADWKELLVTAPARGAAEWRKAADQWKAELARSNELERKVLGPSRKAAQGCMATLRPDFLAVARTLDHKSAVAFTENLSTHPIANLLFTRLVACAAVDDQPEPWISRLSKDASDLRYARGPRIAGHYAALDALTKILADRSKFPVRAQDLRFARSTELTAAAGKLSSKSKTPGLHADRAKGAVKTLKKTAKGLAVTFVSVKRKEMGRECTSSGQIINFRPDGSPMYYQNCRDTGMITIDETAPPMTVPLDWAGGITVGAVMEFDAEYGDKPSRIGLPRFVYSDAKKTKLVSFWGLEI